MKMRRRKRKKVKCFFVVTLNGDGKHVASEHHSCDARKKKKALQFLFFPSAPKCGFIKGNEKIMLLLERVKPEIVALRETIIVVSEKLPLQICKDDPDSAPKTLN